MAIWAQHSKVFKAVIVSNTIYVIDVHGDWLCAPFTQTALAAHIVK